MNETTGEYDEQEYDKQEREEMGRVYHVLMNSRRYGTNAFPCPTLQDAAQTLSWLAVRAEQERQKDTVQRFFCLLPPDFATTETQEAACDRPDTAEGEDAVVLCVAQGALQWIAGEGLDTRPLLVLDAIGSEAEGPFVCWEACARPLAQINHLHRHAIHRYLLLRRLGRGRSRPTEERKKEIRKRAIPS